MADDFFTDEDPFQDIVSSFFGQGPGRRTRVVRRQEREEDEGEFLETSDSFYIIIETPGFDEEDVFIKSKGKELEIQINKKNLEGVKHYLVSKLEQGMHIVRNLPEEAEVKKFSYTVKNGILEVRIPKK
ncbi:MAG: Hsp20/alpha crystallin family protein [Nanoarchaeota archaeon]